MPTHDIVPFGKYKGQPIETLLTDVEYLQWCQTNGVLDRYPWLQVMVVSGQPHEDQPTPAHNRLQERFADWEYCRDVLKALGVDARHVPPGFASWKDVEIACRKKHSDYIRGIPKPSPYAGDREWLQYERACQDAAPAGLMALWDFARDRDIQRGFEVNGWDVVLQCAGTWNIELKPTIGDDYPAVVRQVDRRCARDPRGRGVYSPQDFGARVVVYDRWEAGVSVETIAAMYPRIVWLQLPAATLRPCAATRAAT